MPLARRPLAAPVPGKVAVQVDAVRVRTAIGRHAVRIGVVDESGGSLAVERRFADLVGLPLRRLPRYPGGATDWQNARFPGSTAFVVELPSGRLPPSRAARYVAAILDLARGSG